jgi:hypothetical protein
VIAHPWRASALRWRSSACGSEVIFDGLAVSPLHQMLVARWSGRDRLLVLVVAVLCPALERRNRNKKPPDVGWWSPVLVAHLAELLPPELAPGASRWLPGF